MSERHVAVPVSLLWGIGIGVVATVLVLVGVGMATGDGASSEVTVGAPTSSTTTTRPRPVSSTTTSTTRRSSVVPVVPSTTRPAASTAAADAGPSTGRVDCPSSSRRVGTADELRAALVDARPGDAIELRPGTYPGEFVATGSGTAERPITLCGPSSAVLEGSGISKGYVLHLRDAHHWRVAGFTVRNGQKGVMADSTTASVIEGLLVEDIGDEGIHLRTNSSGNTVVGNTVRRTGLRRDTFGEGIYVGSATSNWGTYTGGQPDRSDFNVIQGNTISQTGSESIDVKEGTTGGRIVDNTMDGAGMTGADSVLDVKGNDWVVEGNVAVHGPEEGFQTHRILDGWGTGNTFRANTIDVDGDGNHLYVHDPAVTGNRVACDNRTASGVALRSNVRCAP